MNVYFHDIIIITITVSILFEFSKKWTISLFMVMPVTSVKISIKHVYIVNGENVPGGVPIRIKHLLHSSAVRYGEIFHSPSVREISRHIAR